MNLRCVRNMFAGRRKSRGQVLVVALVVIIILMVLAIFLFDLQNLIRLRSSTQTAADSAVLTAAAWQGRTLNIIGELNLLKAANMLIADVEPFDDDSKEGVLESVQLLTQMQTRVAYAGPMIGYAAAQEAAKNNGMRASDTFTTYIQDHLEDYVQPPSGLYEELFTDVIPYEDYEWLYAYSAMMEEIVNNGVAAQFVNTRYLKGTPLLIGEGGDLLMDPAFYDAVHTHNFCWFYRRGIEYGDTFDFSSIEMDMSPNGYFVGSELLPLYVSFTTGAPPAEVGNALDARAITPLPADHEALPEITWAMYENGGDGWDETGLYDYVNPYLRSNFRNNYTYGGASARAVCFSRPSLIFGRPSWRHGDSEEPAEEEGKLGEALAFSATAIDGTHSFKEYGDRLAAAESRLQAQATDESVKSSSAAKPFGALDADRPPHDAGVVLPVFTAARLIPAALVRQNLSDRNPDFIKFILEYFGHPSYPDVPPDIRAKYGYFISAIEAFQDRGSGFRVAWRSYDNWRREYMAGPDGISDTGDDRRDPCIPPDRDGGGGGGGGGGGSGPSRPGPSPIH
ncbi:MAG: hypothetical protein ACI8W8_003897 [Rhodothermales bacterium]|jgi:hypothetical protein